MIEAQKNTGVTLTEQEKIARDFGSRGGIAPGSTESLLAAVAGARYDTEEAAFAAMRTLPGVSSAKISRDERRRYDARSNPDGVQVEWMVYAMHRHAKADAHVFYAPTLHQAVCQVLESYRLNPLGFDEDGKPISDARATALRAMVPATKHETGEGAASHRGSSTEGVSARSAEEAAPKPSITAPEDAVDPRSSGPVTHTGMPRGDFEGMGKAPQ